MYGSIYKNVCCNIRYIFVLDLFPTICKYFPLFVALIDTNEIVRGLERSAPVDKKKEKKYCTNV